MSENTEEQKKWEDLTDKEVMRATELLVERNELKQRKVQIAIMSALDITPEDALLQISEGESAHCDEYPIWDGLEEMLRKHFSL